MNKQEFDIKAFVEEYEKEIGAVNPKEKAAAGVTLFGEAIIKAYQRGREDGANNRQKREYMNPEKTLAEAEREAGITEPDSSIREIVRHFIGVINAAYRTGINETRQSKEG